MEKVLKKQNLIACLQRGNQLLKEERERAAQEERVHQEEQRIKKRCLLHMLQRGNLLLKEERE